MLNLNLFTCETFGVALNEERSTKGRRQHLRLYFLLGLLTVLVSISPFVLGLVVWVCPQLYAFSWEKGQDSRPLCVWLFSWLFHRLVQKLEVFVGILGQGDCLLYFWSSGGFVFLISSLHCLFCLLVLQTKGVWLWYRECQHSHQRGRDWRSVWWADSVSLWGIWIHKEFDHK